MIAVMLDHNFLNETLLRKELEKKTYFDKFKRNSLLIIAICWFLVSLCAPPQEHKLGWIILTIGGVLTAGVFVFQIRIWRIRIANEREIDVHRVMNS